MRRQFFYVGCIQVPRGYNCVGIDVVPNFQHLPFIVFQFLPYFKFLVSSLNPLGFLHRLETCATRFPISFQPYTWWHRHLACAFSRSQTPQTESNGQFYAIFIFLPHFKGRNVTKCNEIRLKWAIFKSSPPTFRIKTSFGTVCPAWECACAGSSCFIFFYRRVRFSESKQSFYYI